MKKYFIILLLIIEGCSSSKQSTSFDWCGGGSVSLVPMQIVFTDVLKSSSDSLLSCRGIVRDSSTSDPLGEVNIIICHSIRGCATDFDGKFKFDNLQMGDTLQFSLIGFHKKKIAIRDVVKKIN